MNFISIHEKLLAEKFPPLSDFGPAVLRLQLLEVQLILRKANLALDIRERAQQAALDLRRAIAERPCASRVDLNAKLSLLLEADARNQASRQPLLETIKDWHEQVDAPSGLDHSACLNAA
jgi:hypothetical protein